jgi:hypothetical protein
MDFQRLGDGARSAQQAEGVRDPARGAPKYFSRLSKSGHSSLAAFARSAAFAARRRPSHSAGTDFIRQEYGRLGAETRASSHIAISIARGPPARATLWRSSDCCSWLVAGLRTSSLRVPRLRCPCQSRVSREIATRPRAFGVTAALSPRASRRDGGGSLTSRQDLCWRSVKTSVTATHEDRYDVDRDKRQHAHECPDDERGLPAPLSDGALDRG